MKKTTRSVRSAHTIAATNFGRVVSATRHALFNPTTPILAAGIAYFGTLSFFPLVATLVAVTGIVFSSDQINDLVSGMTQFLPKDISMLVSTQLQNATSHHETNVIVAILAFGLAIYGVSGAVDGIIKAVNTLRHIKDERSFVRQKLVSLLLTVMFIIGMAITLPLVFIGASFLQAVGLPDSLIAVFSIIRWAILLVVTFIGIGIVYHYAPAVRTRKWHWFSRGAVIATSVWMLGTVLFFTYLQYVANFSNAYSLFAGVIALMIWINLGAFSLLVGADVDEALEG